MNKRWNRGPSKNESILFKHDFFKRLPDRRKRCNFCPNVYAQSTANATLKLHLQSNHKAQWKNFQQFDTAKKQKRSSATLPQSIPISLQSFSSSSSSASISLSSTFSASSSYSHSSASSTSVSFLAPFPAMEKKKSENPISIKSIFHAEPLESIAAEAWAMNSQLSTYG